MTWHVDTDTLARYLGSRVSDARAASVEAHLLACATCRRVVARHARTESRAENPHENSWQRILDAVDRPRTSIVERIMTKGGVPQHVARLVAAAPSLRQAWWLAGTGLLAFAAFVAQLGSGTAGTVGFVVGAPLVPVVGVALSYGWTGEPAREVAFVAPYPPFRLVLLRTAAVLGSWLPIAGLLALALPGPGVVAVLWLVPALALCAVSLALATIVDPARAAAVLTLVWIAGAAVTIREPRGLPADELLMRFAAFRPEGQAALGAVAVLALFVTLARRSAFDVWRRP